MIYGKLFERAAGDKGLVAGVIGTGNFATALIGQSPRLSRLEIPVIADVDVAMARTAYHHAGIADDRIVVCDSRSQALAAFERGDRIILEDALIMMQLPIDLVVEATGSPEAGAGHALSAIQHGKHVAMVTKEADVTVGPILKHLADGAGLIYTAVDGDQHGLLIGLVEWVRELGLTLICGGKFSDQEIIHDPIRNTVQRRYSRTSYRRQLQQSDVAAFEHIEPGHAAETVRRRGEIMAEFQSLGGWDLGEMTIAANATGLTPDIDTMHGPVVHTMEIPEVLCTREEGGVLSATGVIDSVIPLRYPQEAGLGGGVFVVVGYASEYSRTKMIRKGLISNHRGSATLIYRPHHLLGVETPITMLCAGLLGIATGAAEYRPRFDVVARAAADFTAGELHPDDYDTSLQSLMRPGRPLADSQPLPFHLGNGNPFSRDVKAGTVITAGMVVRPKDSTLWSLREQQDSHFLGS